MPLLSVYISKLYREIHQDNEKCREQYPALLDFNVNVYIHLASALGFFDFKPFTSLGANMYFRHAVDRKDFIYGTFLRLVD